MNDLTRKASRSELREMAIDYGIVIATALILAAIFVGAV